MHAESGSFAALGAGPEIVLRDPGHGIDHRVAQLEQLLFLAADERVEPLLLVVRGREDGLLRILRSEVSLGAVSFGSFPRASCGFFGAGAFLATGFLAELPVFFAGFDDLACAFFAFGA